MNQYITLYTMYDTLINPTQTLNKQTRQLTIFFASRQGVIKFEAHGSLGHMYKCTGCYALLVNSRAFKR